MKKLESTILNLLLLLHCFLVMLLLFEKSVSIPYWLQPLGRMHPLILHFPIAFIVLLVILNIFKSKIDANTYATINRFLVLLTAFTTVVAAIMGLFLSLEADTTNLMSLHKWIGVGVSFFIYALTFIKKEQAFKTVLYIGFIGVIFAGHYGAGLTHGTNFITEPLAKTEVVAVNENTPIFQGFVKPILDTKCISCHNSEKRKGDLDMSSFEKMMLGGKGGDLWIAGNAEESALLKRIHLPVQHKKHMPPQGKKQLTKSEINLLAAWINHGAEDTIALAQLSKLDTLGLLVSKQLEKKDKKQEAQFVFNFAKKKDIEALQNPFRTVIQKSPASPGLEVVIHGRQTYKPEFLTGLSPVKEQVVSLNLSYLPIDETSIDFIGGLPHLEDLHLNFTDVSTADLKGLSTCNNLKTLSLTGTKIDSEISTLIRQLPLLEKVFLWNTELSNEKIEALISQFPNIHFESGFKSDGNTLKLTPPILVSKKTIISQNEFIELGHKMPGAEIRYTTDGSVPNTSSPLFKEPIKIDLTNNTVIKCIAYKENWSPSDLKVYNFIDKGHTPENFELAYEGENNEFIGDGSIILTDHLKGGNGPANSSPFWATFNHKNHLDATAYFGEAPPNLDQIVFNYGVHRWQKTEPLASLEVWGGNDKSNLSLIKTIKKTNRKLKTGKDNKDVSDKRPRRVSINLAKANYKYYKIVAKPHKNSRIYVDQIYFY